MLGKSKIPIHLCGLDMGTDTVSYIQQLLQTCMPQNEIYTAT